jgi:hypothetical protein
MVASPKGFLPELSVSFPLMLPWEKPANAKTNPALVQLLYRVDVPEKKLKAVLADHAGEDAGVLMADLMIERQQQKMEARKNFRVKERYDDGEERW